MLLLRFECLTRLHTGLHLLIKIPFKGTELLPYGSLLMLQLGILRLESLMRLFESQLASLGRLHESPLNAIDL
ncbi:hypothetical protein D3C80_2155340 [compost metagenome]